MTEVVTGEAVALDLTVAKFPSRIAALLLDMLLQVALLAIVAGILGATSRSVSGDYVAAEFLTIYVLLIVAYPTTFETLSRGKTLGKMALGLRVVGDDGSPVRFRQALVRALVGVFEIWTFLLAPIGLVTSLVSARGKRVGDFFAGTYVIQERAPSRQALPLAFSTVPPPLAAWAEVLEVARLSDQTAEAAGSYLRRFAELSPQARDALGVQLANAVAAQVSPLPPAGTPPAAYLSAVLAVRRAREQASLVAGRPQLGPDTPAEIPVRAPESAASHQPPAQPAPPQPGLGLPQLGQPALGQPGLGQPALTPLSAEQTPGQQGPPPPEQSSAPLAPPA